MEISLPGIGFLFGTDKMIRLLNLYFIRPPLPLLQFVEVLAKRNVCVDYFWYFCVLGSCLLMGVSYLFHLSDLCSCNVFYHVEVGN